MGPDENLKPPSNVEEGPQIGDKQIKELEGVFREMSKALRGALGGQIGPIKFITPGSDKRKEFPARADGLERSIGFPDDLEKKVRSRFSKLRKLKESKSPLVQELRNYQKEIAEKLSELKGPAALGPGRAHRLLEFLEEPTARSVFERVVERLRTETSYLHELEDTNIAAYLGTGLKKGKYGARVEFVAGKKAEATNFEPHVSGSYDYLWDKAKIRGEAPSVQEMWAELAESGSLPQQIAFLDHELTHDHQASLLSRLGMIGISGAKWGMTGMQGALGFQHSPSLGLFSAIGFERLMRPLEVLGYTKLLNDRILAEVHAWDAHTSSPAFIDPMINDHEDVLAQIMTGYARGPKDTIRAMAALKLVRALRLLGRDDKEIGKLVQRERMDPEKAVYPSLYEEAEKLFEKNGIFSGAEKDALLEVLEGRALLEKYLQRHRAAKIASEELLRASAI